jgi:hypothetical protein
LPDFADDELIKEPKTPDLLRKYQFKNDYPIIPWADVQGNKFLHGINHMMLTPEGFYTFKQVRIIGQRNWEDKIYAFVFYNREFVIQKLAAQLLELKPAGFNEIQRVIGESWQFCKQLDEEDNF